MGYYVVIDGVYTQPLATFRGWADFKLWICGFEDKEFFHTKHLIDHGWDQELPQMLEDLQEMLRHNPPAHIASTIKDLVHTIKSGPKNPDVIVLTDGSVEDDGSDDEDFEDDWESGEDEDFEDDWESGQEVKPSRKKSVKKKTVKKKAVAKKKAPAKQVRAKSATKKSVAKKSTPTKKTTITKKSPAKKTAKKKR